MIFLGIDFGFGTVKAACQRHEGIKTVSFPSVFALHTPSPFSTDIKTYELEDRKWVVGEDALYEPARFSPANFKDICRLAPLVFQAVSDLLAVGQGEGIILSFSVPPAYWREREKLTEVFGEDLFVVPQGFGAMYYAVDRNPTTFEGIGTALVLDIGYNTVDYVFCRFENPGHFKVVRGDTWTDLGVRRLLEIFRAILPPDLQELNRRTLLRFLEKGRGNIAGKAYSFEEEKKRALQSYLEALEQALSQVLGELYREADVLVYVGGGVHYVPKDLLPHHRVVVPKEPVFANVLGQLTWMIERAHV